MQLARIHHFVEDLQKLAQFIALAFKCCNVFECVGKRSLELTRRHFGAGVQCMRNVDGFGVAPIKSRHVQVLRVAVRVIQVAGITTLAFHHAVSPGATAMWQAGSCGAQDPSPILKANPPVRSWRPCKVLAYAVGEIPA